jgi:hypothetical protein
MNEWYGDRVVGVWGVYKIVTYFDVLWIDRYLCMG